MTAQSIDQPPVSLISGLPLTPDQRLALEREGVDVLLDGAARDEDRAVELAPEAAVWFGPGLTPKVFASAAKLRWFQTASVGIEYFLFPALAESDVAMTNVQGRHTATSEHALALILAIARKLDDAVLQQRDGVWKAPAPSAVVKVFGSRLVVLGTGRIGRDVAQRAKAFGMDVVGVSRSGADVPGFDRVHPVTEMTEVVADADWVVAVLPNTPESKQVVSRKVLSSFRRGSVFINVGRGKTVDEAALVEQLESGRIRAAGLDVFEKEPLPAESVLWKLPNVIITPHSAGVIPGVEVRTLGVDALLANLPKFRSGTLPALDKVRGY